MTGALSFISVTTLKSMDPSNSADINCIGFAFVNIQLVNIDQFILFFGIKFSDGSLILMHVYDKGCFLTPSISATKR